MTPEMPLEHYFTLLRNDFASFARRCFKELWPTTTLLWSPHLDLIAGKLDAVRRGEIRRLILNVPPRSGKSLLTSIALPAFILGHDPTAQVVGVSYSQDLALNFSAGTRTIMLSKFYRHTFPTRLEGAPPSKRELTTTAKGYRFATSLGGTLTGRGGNFVLLDDPQKPAELLSDVQRKAAIEWIDGTGSTRLNDKDRGAIVLTMQRIHQNDLAGHLIAKGGWEVLSLPAIAEEDETYPYDSFFGPCIYRRSAGGVLHPKRESLVRLNEAKVAMGSYHFAAQYQQRPAPLGGGLIKIDWFGTYDPANPPAFDRIIQSWDCASKLSERADYSVGLTVGIKGKQIFLISVWRDKVEYNDLKRAVLQQRSLFNPDKILIEDASAGTQLIQQFKVEGIHNIEAVKPSKDKFVRMSTQTGFLETGQMFLPAQAHWREGFFDEVAVFPLGRHDDQVDALSQLLNYLANDDFADLWVKHFEKMAKEARGEI